MQSHCSSKSRFVRFLGLAALSLAIAAPAAAGTVVYLRTSCGSLSPCVTTSADLQTWLASNPPSASNPTTVDIGPGDFQRFTCSNWDYLTLRGMGRDRTRFVNITGGQTNFAALMVSGCDEFGVQDLSIVGKAVGAQKGGSGNMTVTNVDIRAGGGSLTTYAWWDGLTNCPETKPQVFWFGSRMIVEATAVINFALYSQCAEHWVYGSDLEVHGSANTPSNSVINTLYLLQGGDVRFFGGSIRALVGAAVDTDFNDWVGSGFTIPGFAAAFVAVGGHFHAHGALLVADAKNSNLPQVAIGIKLEHSLHAHTPETAFRVEAGPGGIAHRLLAIDSTVESPFLWPASESPPPIQSVNGSDMFVETDCASSGDCGGTGSGAQTHLMLYNPDNCGTSDPWFDVVTGACRQE